ncbi:hypothetical protein NFC81_03360 [Salinispirillum sp. LH 10-3-1]|uniref:Uncharacterized protein n=1 Tax=Salinispirillum sp. LH 10-3-1 TaxID=2952525 RepID=A0AB38YHX6_9GAMM
MKMYMGDFDENGLPDILMWGKVYHSRMSDDPIKGFELVGQNWLHYSKTPAGVYDIQDTDAETIRDWLSVKNLTWSQGYPRYSECEGEEGQLVPEWHDPLLNDPDVLQ